MLRKCAWLRRPSGGCAGAGTHLCRAAGRERSWICPAPSPCPARPLGRGQGRRAPVLAGLTCTLTHSQQNAERRSQEAPEGPRSQEEADEGGRGRVRCRSAEGRKRVKYKAARSAARPQGRREARSAEQQRDAAVAAGLGNALGGTRPHQKPEQLVLDGRKSQAGEKRKQLPGQGQISFVAALFASFVCCFQMTIKSLRLSTQFIQKETGKGPAATAAGERRRQRSSISKDSICADTQSKCSSSSSSSK